MFRRSTKTEDLPPNPETPRQKGPGAKGRPTRSRKEAEAAAKERARAGMDKKAARKLDRERRARQNQKLREGMRTGDERYLPRRDQGPVRRFIRNYVDARVSVAEFLLPLLVLIMVLQYSGSQQAQALGSALWTTTILVILIDSIWLIFRLRRTLHAKFPDESLRGTTFYAVMRTLQLRWMRMPKPQVKIGGAPK